MSRAAARSVRWVLVAAAALLAVLVARPASAATRVAPQCDPRAAITFAPAPTLEIVDTSVDVPRERCASIDDGAEAARQGRAPEAPRAPLELEATLPARAPPCVAGARALFPPRGRDLACPSGVPRALERPPRG